MLSSPLNLLSNNISCIIHFMRIIISDMSFPIFFLILPNDTIQHLRLKWSDRLTGVVSKKSESWERRLPSNRFNEAQRRDKAMMYVHAAWGSLWQPPFKRWVKSLNILIEAQLLTSPPCCHLQPRCLMACYYLENSDTYHNETQIHWIYHTSKRSCGRVLWENDIKIVLKVCYLLFPLHLWNCAVSIFSAAQI